MMSFWEEQNQRIENGTWDGGAGEQFILHLDTLMIVSGCIDRYVQYPYYPQQAFRANGFGIEAVSETVYNAMVASIPKCLSRIQTCRDAAALSDPENLGINASVNALCDTAESWCRRNIVSPYTETSGLDYYDISTQSPPSFPAGFHQGFLNREWVQAELGVPLNWTGSSPQASNAYRDIGDYPRDSWLEDLGFLLDNGIKVSLVHGDLDFACPVRLHAFSSYTYIHHREHFTNTRQWAGGDAVAKAIPWTGSEGYASAQYADIQTNDSYIGGLVRQYGNLSFIRTYHAGHSIPSYQPETAYRTFTRALFNLDIATGTQSTAGSIEAGTAYKSAGRDVPDVQLQAKEQGLRYCYTYNAGSCEEWQIEMIRNGSAEICNWLFVDGNSTLLFPEEIGKCREEWAGSAVKRRQMDTAQRFQGGAAVVKGRGLGEVLMVVGLVGVGLML
jgi:hypothetical protein